jgi:ribosomal protein S18 acetylase RimI-like enzyme
MQSVVALQLLGLLTAACGYTFFATPKINVREAGLDDLPGYVKLRESSLGRPIFSSDGSTWRSRMNGVNPHQDSSPEAVAKRKLLEKVPRQVSGKVVTIIAEDEKSRLVGFVDTYIRNKRPGMPQLLRLANMYVVPEMRRKGIASQLLEGAASRAKSLDISYLSLDVLRTNGGARQLYESAGFVVQNKFSGPLLDKFEWGKVDMIKPLS